MDSSWRGIDLKPTKGAVATLATIAALSLIGAWQVATWVAGLVW